MNIRIVLSVVIAVLAVWGGAATQLDPLIGATAAKSVTAICNLTVASLAAALGVISTQASQVTSVTNDPAKFLAALQAMPGISKVLVNTQANDGLAQAAISPGNEKIVPEDGRTQRALVDAMGKEGKSG